ncbi:variable surface protein [Plasmodium gonderi]|uniref:Variable surface protein n=1 Tax=Plasmodium gonderi TaxID=77519 RepID=A0A1Y1JS91_PLAGO|nr:variable surface protein [Plasmodium gonderi]GAW84318.1 variable surface protein [Plasmodium gonderi]
MTENITVNKDFNFEGIFPTCRKEYERVKGRDRRFWAKFSSMCSDFRNNINVIGYNFHVSDLCSYLGVYLHHIEHNTDNDKKRRCLYFFYKLKDLVNTYKGQCYTTKECYEKMRQEYITQYGASKNYPAKISNICEDYAAHNNIDDNIYKVMKYLDDLYIKFEYLKRCNHKTNKHSCDSNNKCIDIYDKLLEINKKSQNEGLKSELDKFKSDYDKYVKANTPSEDQGNLLYLSTGSNAGTAVSTFAIIIILFVLYKVEKTLNILYYTVFGKFLKSPVKKVKRSLKKNKNDHFNLIYSFEKAQNDSNYNNYRIAYSSVD